ncbi:MAG: Uma2 family endonuclease [Coleofasciculaceae cyanobacterium SM2_1_6]|nr:Uma2 family endonuclease [Coleofasciculaceae cyanobacterium SM2_1_6]
MESTQPLIWGETSNPQTINTITDRSTDNIPANLPEVPPEKSPAKSTQTATINLPDHRHLPDSDGTFVKNFQEHPQSIILTSSIIPILEKLHPDRRYCIGQDSGIYWRLTEPAEKGAEAPDWFYVPNVSPLLDGEYRRSYVLWKEFVAPLIAIEFVSGTGLEEHDRTPAGEGHRPGKFWVYEQAIRIPFYGIFTAKTSSLEVYHLVDGSYELLAVNDRGHYPIAPMGVELGIQEEGGVPWLRWWDQEGNLLLTGTERAVEAEAIAVQERLAKQEAEEKVTRLAARLRALGIDPDQL